MRKNGNTLDCIAKSNYISGERVRQIIKKIDMVNEALAKKKNIEAMPLDEMLSLSVEELCLNVRSANCLSRCMPNIKTIKELISLTEKDLLKIKNYGKKSLDLLKEELASHGLFLNKEKCPVCGKELE
jgi:DNA-directed RNA polymerase alpha subunit